MVHCGGFDSRTVNDRPWRWFHRIGFLTVPRWEIICALHVEERYAGSIPVATVKLKKKEIYSDGKYVKNSF